MLRNFPVPSVGAFICKKCLERCAEKYADLKAEEDAKYKASIHMGENFAIIT